MSPTEKAAYAPKQTQEEVIERLSEIDNDACNADKQEIDLLKQTFYKLHKAEQEAARKAFEEQGGKPEEFVPAADPLENKFKEIMSSIKEKRSEMAAEAEREKEDNLAKKLQILDKMKDLIENSDDTGKIYNEFKELQQQWNDIKQVPIGKVNELWKSYQLYTEKFYDLIKINNQFREYDFKKNLELKTALCEAVEKLATEPDAVSAFHQLQKMHQQWREIGPVAKEIREELWARFKAASNVVNKRHQAHFDKQKEQEMANLTAKTAICEQIEAIDLEALKNVKDWDTKSKEVLSAQAQWRTIGYAPKKHNQKIFDRFRRACDRFFEQKSAFFKDFKAETQKNLDAKRALCEQAEALMNSTDWKATADKLIALQKEWKATGGPMNRKRVDALWKRFNTACDYFFDQKKKAGAPQKEAEEKNLLAKRALIEQISQLDEALDPNEALAQLKHYMADWSRIGFVPMRDKDKVQKAYKEALDKQFDRLKVDQNDRKMQSFRSSLGDMGAGEKGKSRLFNEREKLMRQFERMKNEVQTYATIRTCRAISARATARASA